MYSYGKKGDAVNVSFKNWNNDKQYQKILDNFIRKKGLDKRKIMLLVGLIYINMSALHHYPFNNALMAFGSSIISEILNDETN